MTTEVESPWSFCRWLAHITTTATTINLWHGTPEIKWDGGWKGQHRDQSKPYNLHKNTNLTIYTKIQTLQPTQNFLYAKIQKGQPNNLRYTLYINLTMLFWCTILIAWWASRLERAVIRWSSMSWCTQRWPTKNIPLPLCDSRQYISYYRVSFKYPDIF